MKKLPVFLATGAMLLTSALSSCSDDKDEVAPGPVGPTLPIENAVFILNQGQYYNGIEGSLNVIDMDNMSMDSGIFRKANDRSLGDTPQCGVVYGDKIYLGIYESNTIEILDRRTYKSLKQIRLGKSACNPRSMVAEGDYVYIAMFDGYVSRLNIKTLEIDKTVKVGPNPETIAEYNGKLYVPNSDGMNYEVAYGNTASEIDLATFTVTKTFEVGLNPSQFLANDRLYLLCRGDYGPVNSRLYEVNDNYSVTEITDATLVCAAGDQIAIVNEYYDNNNKVDNNPAHVVDYKIYAPSTGSILPWNISRPEYASTIFFDEKSGGFIITSYHMNGHYPNYNDAGYVNIYSPDGKVAKKFDIGIGPAYLFSMN